MKTKDLAEKLNGMEHGYILPEALLQEARNSGLVIVRGFSDDSVQFNGAICDEVSAWHGGSIYVGPKGSEIVATWWTEKDGNVFAGWEISTELPHYSFDVMEDGKLFCRGIVFNMGDL